MARPKKRSQRTSSTPPRPTRAIETPVPGDTAPAEDAVQPSTRPDAKATETPASRSDKVDWANEYNYVIGDLRQLFVVSVGLFAVMIIIGYIL